MNTEEYKKASFEERRQMRADAAMKAVEDGTIDPKVGIPLNESYCDKMIQIPVLNESDAKKIADRLGLKYELTGLTKDGTNRKVWTMTDPEKQIIGTLVTSRAIDSKGRRDFKKIQTPWDENFSHMSLFGFTENDDIDTFYPKTKYYAKEYKAYVEKNIADKKFILHPKPKK